MLKHLRVFVTTYSYDLLISLKLVDGDSNGNGTVWSTRHPNADMFKLSRKMSLNYSGFTGVIGEQPARAQPTWGLNCYSCPSVSTLKALDGRSGPANFSLRAGSKSSGRRLLAVLSMQTFIKRASQFPRFCPGNQNRNSLGHFVLCEPVIVCKSSILCVWPHCAVAVLCPEGVAGRTATTPTAEAGRWCHQMTE